MARHFLERALGFATHLGGLARGGVTRAVHDLRDAAQQRAEERRLAEEARVAREKQARAAVEAAAPAFQAAVVDALASYTPQLSQEQVNAVLWTEPEPVARLLAEELTRIDEVVTSLVKSAGFPLDTQEKRAREILEQIWLDSWKPFERKAFGDLVLPHYFEFKYGHLSYEAISTARRDGTYGRCYVGENTGHKYLSPPKLVPAPRRPVAGD